jgi:NAD(P)-dependent dehydrogenase (short-subunit alcohol dehydrogenase family)
VADRSAALNPLSVVTGGSRGIGLCLIQKLLRETDVLNISRGSPSLQKPPGGRVLHELSADLGDAENAESDLQEWLDRFPGYEVVTLVHNAATLSLRPLHEASRADIHHALEVNVVSPVRLTAKLLDARRFSGQGAQICYVVSSLGRARDDLSFAGIGLYSMTKAALDKAAAVQARELESESPEIRVLRVHPGIVDTEMQRELRSTDMIDARFKTKTAGLPDYEPGEWRQRPPSENMRTISADFAAEFVVWALRDTMRAEEYDFYNTARFHEHRYD